jgi:hypothetical protein
MHPRQSRQKRRIAEFQANWSNIKTELPPQLSRRHSECHLNILYRSQSLTVLNSRHDLDRYELYSISVSWH